MILTYQVNVIGLTFTDIGIATKVNFSSARSGKRIIWTHSKRLTPGTLLAMSTVKDKFKTHCKVVVVASRSGMMEVWPPEVDLFFADPQEATVDPQQRYILLEARMGYFEASRHTLLALQRMVDEELVHQSITLTKIADLSAVYHYQRSSSSSMRRKRRQPSDLRNP